MIDYALADYPTKAHGILGVFTSHGVLCAIPACKRGVLLITMLILICTIVQGTNKHLISSKKNIKTFFCLNEIRFFVIET